MNTKQKSPRNRTISLNGDEIEELNKYISKEYSGVENKIYNGDFFELIDQIPDKSFELVIIDPPYNLNKLFGCEEFKAMDDKDYEDYMSIIFSGVVPKLKDNGSLYICGDWKSSHLMYKVLSKYMHVINRITWARDKGRGSDKNWKNNHEDIYFAVKKKSDYVFNADAVKVKKKVIAPYKDASGNNKDWYTENGENFRMTYPSNFWNDIVIPFWSMPENTEHPTQKPEKLLAKLILASSNPGDTVFDPFAGVCSTLVTAKNLEEITAE